ncbi:MAG: hypothetical protein ACJAZX_000643 [Rickettsiales bacterium]|jgi:uncharacterized protein YggE
MKDHSNTANKKTGIKSIFLTTLSIVALFSITYAAFFMVSLNNKNPVQTNLTIIGNATVTTNPDSVFVNVIFRSSNDNISDAQKDIDKQLKKLTTELGTLGVDKKDIIPLSNQSNPKYHSKSIECDQVICPIENKMIGYDITQIMGVKVAKVDIADQIVQKIKNLNIEVSNKIFIIDDESKFQSEANKLAIKDSRSKAEEIAKSLGLKLGKIVNLEEENAIQSSQMSQKYISGEVPGLSYTGNKIVKSTVRVTYSTTTNSN